MVVDSGDAEAGVIQHRVANAAGRKRGAVGGEVLGETSCPMRKINRWVPSSAWGLNSRGTNMWAGNGPDEFCSRGGTGREN